MNPPADDTRVTPASRVRALLGWGAFAALALVFCELGARLDDWFFEGVPVFANQSYSSMFVFDEYGQRRGIPGARWKRVRLNNLGFRGADVPARPGDGCKRWMFLGASETFGEPTRADTEYPARIRTLAPPQFGCVDVMNTAYPGIAPFLLEMYYATSLREYRPDVVFVYPSTQFYLSNDIGTRPLKPVPTRTPTAPVANQPFSLDTLMDDSRFLERVKDTAEVPARIQEMRLARWIDAETRGRPAGWMYQDVPQDRLAAYEADLRSLVATIRASGATPVLLTHAIRSMPVPRPEDHGDLFGMRHYLPRAAEPVIAAFDYRAADVTRKVGAELGVKVIDVARVLDGRRDAFIDLVHPTPEGHNEIAHLLLDGMRATDGKN